jgi:hypothetical protein
MHKSSDLFCWQRCQVSDSNLSQCNANKWNFLPRLMLWLDSWQTIEEGGNFITEQSKPIEKVQFSCQIHPPTLAKKVEKGSRRREKMTTQQGIHFLFSFSLTRSRWPQQQQEEEQQQQHANHQPHRWRKLMPIRPKLVFSCCCFCCQTNHDNYRFSTNHSLASLPKAHFL